MGLYMLLPFGLGVLVMFVRLHSTLAKRKIPLGDDQVGQWVWGRERCHWYSMVNLILPVSLLLFGAHEHVT